MDFVFHAVDAKELLVLRNLEPFPLRFEPLRNIRVDFFGHSVELEEAEKEGEVDSCEFDPEILVKIQHLVADLGALDDHEGEDEEHCETLGEAEDPVRFRIDVEGVELDNYLTSLIQEADVGDLLIVILGFNRCDFSVSLGTN